MLVGIGGEYLFPPTREGDAVTDEHYLRITMQAAQEAIQQGDMPFGACVVDENGSVL